MRFKATITHEFEYDIDFENYPGSENFETEEEKITYCMNIDKESFTEEPDLICEQAKADIKIERVA